MVKRLLKVKEGVKRMILSDDWKRWLESTRSIRAEATDIQLVIEDPRFWSRLEEICVVMEPAFKMIKLLEADSQTVADVYATAVEVGHSLYLLIFMQCFPCLSCLPFSSVFHIVFVLVSCAGFLFLFLVVGSGFWVLVRGFGFLFLLTCVINCCFVYNLRRCRSC